MPDIKTSLKAELTGHAGLAALVGARIYPLKLPQTPVLPAVVYQRFDSSVKYLLDGASNADMDWFQIDCWGDTEISADAVAWQVDAALRRFIGLLGGDTVVSGVWIEDKTDFYEPDTGLYRVSIDIKISY